LNDRVRFILSIFDEAVFSHGWRRHRDSLDFDKG